MKKEGVALYENIAEPNPVDETDSERGIVTKLDPHKDRVVDEQMLCGETEHDCLCCWRLGFFRFNF